MFSTNPSGDRRRVNRFSGVGVAMALAAALDLAGAPARAQDDGLQADRPDFTNGPDPLPPHVAQLEAGWAQEHVSTDTKNSFGLGVLRWGVANRVEMRADIPTWFHAESGPKLDSGFGDAGFGAKFLLARGGGDVPRLGLIADIDLPTGDRAFTSSGAGYNGTLAAERDFGPIDASANLLLGNDDDTGVREWTTGASLSLGFSPVRKLDAFAEWYVLATGSSASQNFLDTGGTIPVGRHFLVDASAGHGVGIGERPWFYGMGGTWRW
jgi:hypothetical protein